MDQESKGWNERLENKLKLGEKSMKEKVLEKKLKLGQKGMKGNGLVKKSNYKRRKEKG